MKVMRHPAIAMLAIAVIGMSATAVSAAPVPRATGSLTIYQVERTNAAANIGIPTAIDQYCSYAIDVTSFVPKAYGRQWTLKVDAIWPSGGGIAIFPLAEVGYTHDPRGRHSYRFNLDRTSTSFSFPDYDPLPPRITIRLYLQYDNAIVGPRPSIKLPSRVFLTKNKVIPVVAGGTICN